jgi:hypothetical protein
MASFAIGAICIVERVGHIGEGLDVGAADQWLIRGRAAAQPLGIELAHVTLGQRPIFAIAGPLRLSKLVNSIDNGCLKGRTIEPQLHEDWRFS